MSFGSLLLCSYLTTLLIELPIGFLWNLCNPKDHILMICVNTMTNPPIVLMSFFLNIRMPLNQARFCFLMLEAGVFIVEAMMYDRWFPKISRPWLYSLTVNGASFFGGIVLSNLIL